jgi:hypothetical protein
MAQVGAHSKTPESPLIYGEIGDDPAELAALAEAIVVVPPEYDLTRSGMALFPHGASITHARIKDLRKLVEAVQSHPSCRVPRRQVDGTENHPPNQTRTRLKIHQGEVVVADLRSLDIVASLSLSPHFAGTARFDRARFAGDAWFVGASFEGTAWFGLASFAGDARFDRTSFAGDAWFVEARFEGPARFDLASFVGAARFGRARFEGDARFAGASFEAAALFGRARFEGDARFGGASFEGTARFDLASCAGAARFDGTRFAQRVGGDFRGFTVRTCKFGPKSPSLERSRSVRLRRLFHSAWTSYLTWRGVRSLGQLQILNRVSVVALVAVPSLAGLWEVLGAHLPGWPAMTPTLALAFFAAVAVTIGLLLYQLFVPAEVRSHDEDGFVEQMHKRYPEGQADRNDGLRRAVEKLEALAALRPYDRHRNFVLHHGETIWIPPREHIEWFQDPEEPVPRRAIANIPTKPVTEATSEAEAKVPKRVPARSRDGFVPGAERARITIEQGARAEYWLTSRRNVGAAVASLFFYLMGICILLVILFIQSVQVGVAAGWWNAPSIVHRLDHSGTSK